MAASAGQSGAGWTLAGAAVAAGLHSATLIKRFGSRHGLLLALSRRWVAAIPTAATTPDAQGELLAWAASLSSGQDSSAQLLAGVDMLVEDLRDEQLRALLHQGWTAHTTYLTDLVRRCQQQGHLRSVLPAPAIAGLLLDAAHGAMLRAAAHPDPARALSGHAVTDLLEALA